jgi:hypothetical protein
LIVLLKNGCWVFSVALKNIKVNDLRSALCYHGQQNTYYIEKIYANYIEKIYANSDLDSVFTKTLECLGGIAQRNNS